MPQEVDQSTKSDRSQVKLFKIQFAELLEYELVIIIEYFEGLRISCFNVT